MDRFDRLRVFVHIAEMESFIKAARLLGLPRASVSAAIKELEAELGTRLLHRTTRTVHVTADGTQLLERAKSLLADIEDIDSLFQKRRREAAGRLNVDAPSRIARRLIAPALPTLLRRYPRLQLGLRSTDRAIDLVQEGVDCAVRVGSLRQSSLVLHPLGKIALINCASPEYLRRVGSPTRPEDLRQGHSQVGYGSTTTDQEISWDYVFNGKESSIAIPAQVIVDNAESYIACCLAGLGLIQIPRFDVQDLLEAGRLMEVMPEFRAASMPIALLYPHRRQRSHRLSAFIEWFEALIQPHLERGS